MGYRREYRYWGFARYWWRCFVALVLLAGVGLSHAEVVIAQFPPNPGVMPGGGWQFTANSTFADPVAGSRAWVNGTYGGVPGAKVVDALTIKGPAGPLVLSVARSASLSAIGAAAGRCLMMANPYCAAGTAAYLAYDHFRGRGTPAGIVHDPGIEPASTQMTTEQWCLDNAVTDDTKCVSTNDPLSAYRSAFASQIANSCGSGYTCTGRLYSDRGALKDFGIYYVGGGSEGWVNPYHKTYGQRFRETTSTACAFALDALDPSLSYPKGHAVGPDGKCHTGRYTDSKTPEQAGTLFAQYPPGDPAAVAQGVVAGGQPIAAAPAGVTGPVSQVGTPVSSTTTSGSASSTTTTTGTTTDAGTTTTTTTTNNPQYVYNYGSSSVTYNTVNNYTTTTTTTNNETGAVTTKTENKTEETKMAAPAEFDPQDPCTKTPDSVACMKLGDPGSSEVSKVGVAVPVFIEEVVSLPSACPAPVVISGRSYAFEPVCDAAIAIRPFLLVGAAMSCLMLMLAAVRTI